MNGRRIAKWSGFLLCLVVTSAALAQRHGPRKGGRPGEFPPGKDPGKTIEMIRMYKMVEALELTEEQCAKIFPIIARAGKERRERQRVLEDTLRDLKKLVHDDNAADQELKQKMGAFRELLAKQRASEEELLNALTPHLSPKQQAQLILFHHEFERTMRNLIGRVRAGGGPPGPPGERMRMRNRTRERRGRSGSEELEPAP